MIDEQEIYRSRYKGKRVNLDWKDFLESVLLGLGFAAVLAVIYFLMFIATP